MNRHGLTKLYRFGWIIPAAYGLAAAFGVLMFVVMFFEMEYDSSILYTGIVAISLTISIAQEIVRTSAGAKNVRIIMVAVLAVIYALAALICREDIIAVIKFATGKFIDIANSYYRSNLSCGWIHTVNNTVSDVAHNATGILLLLCPVIFVMQYEIMLKLNCYITVAVSFMMIMMAFMLGRVPPFIPTCILAAVCTCLLPSVHEREAGLIRAAAMSVIVLITAALSWYFILPLVEKQWEKGIAVRERVVDYWTKWEQDPSSLSLTRLFDNIGRAHGGVNSGALGDVEGIDFNGEVQLIVTVDKLPEDTIYLKGFVGSLYTGHAWQAQNDDMEETGLNIGYKSAEEINGNLGNDSAVSIRIERKKASAKYIYQPYGAEAQSNVKQGMRKYEFAYYPVDRNWINLRYYPPSGRLPEEEQRYRQHVTKMYTGYDDKSLQQLSMECRALDSQYMRQDAEYIRKRLSGNAYDINVGVTPADKDFIDYFMYNQRAGYCTHFASAATMMLRMCGHPARYVGGYIVTPDLFIQNDDGTYSAQVKDDKAHAWAEVYVDRVGWLPFETTPGYSDGAMSAGGNAYMQQPSEGSSSSADEGDNAANSAASDMDNDDDEEMETSEEGAASDNQQVTWNLTGINGSKNDNVMVRITMAAAVITGCVLLAAVLVMLLCKMGHAMVERHFRIGRRCNYNAAIEEMFHWLYNIMLYSGLPQNADCTSPGYIQEICVHFPFVSETEYEEVTDIVTRANYSNEQLTVQDAVKVGNMCHNVLKAAEAKYNLLRRIIFYISICVHTN